MLAKAADALVLLSARPHDGHDRSFASLLELLDPSLTDGRGRVVRLLAQNGPASIQKLVEGLALLGFQNKDNPNLQGVGAPRGETPQWVRAWEEAPLLDDLVVNTRYRATLENRGLVRVVYRGVEDTAARHGRELEQNLRIPSIWLPYYIGRLLDSMRRMGALNRPLLAYHAYGVAFPDELKAAQWERRFQNPVGMPIGTDNYPDLRCDPDEVPAGVSVKQIWSPVGFRTSTQKVLLHLSQRLANAVPTPEGVEFLLRLLAEESFLAPATLHGYKQDVRLYQVSTDCLELEFEAATGSPLEYRCVRLLEGAGLRPSKQYAISETPGGRPFTVADFAFLAQRVAVYVDGASIHLGTVLRRDRGIEERLRGMTPPWSVVRLGRKEIDGSPGDAVGRVQAALRAASPAGSAC